MANAALCRRERLGAPPAHERARTLTIYRRTLASPLLIGARNRGAAISQGLNPIFSDHGPARLQLIAIAGRKVLQGVPHLTDHAVPVAGTGLTKLSQGWVPRTVVAVRQPAPASIKAVPKPNRHAERTGEVGDRRIDTDDEVEVDDERRGILKVMKVGGGAEVEVAGGTSRRSAPSPGWRPSCRVCRGRGVRSRARRRDAPRNSSRPDTRQTLH